MVFEFNEIEVLLKAQLLKSPNICDLIAIEINEIKEHNPRANIGEIWCSLIINCGYCSLQDIAEIKIKNGIEWKEEELAYILYQLCIPLQELK